jgi:hypothetical protein
MISNSTMNPTKERGNCDNVTCRPSCPKSSVWIKNKKTLILKF